MKREELNELRGKSVEELTAAITEKKQSVEDCVLQGFEGAQSWRQTATLRRDIARLHTLIAEQQASSEAN